MSGQRGCLGGSFTLLVVLCVRFRCSTLLLLQIPQKWQLALVFLYLLVQIVPTAYVCSLVAYNVFIFCCLRRCLSTYKHCSKGSQVPDCLTGVFLHLNIFMLFTRVMFIQFSNFNVY